MVRFFYSSYDKPDERVSAKTDQHKLYFHKIGTPQSDDELVYGGTTEQKHRYVGADVGGDDRYLMISAANSTGQQVFVKTSLRPVNSLRSLLTARYVLT